VSKIEQLAELLQASSNTVFFGGAGVSTESGIPDFRSKTGLFAAQEAYGLSPEELLSRTAFDRNTAIFFKYYKENLVFTDVQPNAAHLALSELEGRGKLQAVITQNVDGLHQAAGAQQVIELHGSLDRVTCLACGCRSSRHDLDQRLREANPGWRARSTVINPDGDAVLDDDQAGQFRVVDCLTCGGLLKPDVIFFGENVPRPRVEECYALTGRARMLLVLGSSLTVMSGYRFVRHASKHAIPVAIVNQGATRGDDHAVLTIDAPLGPALTALTAELGAPG